MQAHVVFTLVAMQQLQQQAQAQVTMCTPAAEQRFSLLQLAQRRVVQTTRVLA